MSYSLWSEVDAYVEGLLLGEDPVLEEAERASAEAGLPPISVSAAQGKLLHLLARIQGARRILELGTLGGYSSIWLARALAPGGRLVTLELQERYARVVRANLEHAGLGSLVEVRVGPAMGSLEALIAEGAEPFEMVFIDADKRSTGEYFLRALELMRPGAILIVDNVVRGGAVVEADSRDPGVVGIRRFHELLARRRGVSATTIQTVGVKGYDGFTLVRVE